MPRSAFNTWHPCHERRRALRRQAFTQAKFELERLWAKRGRSWREPCISDIRISVIVGPYDVRWHVSKGNIRIPGDVGVYRAHDPVQAQVLIDYAAAKLAWMRDREQLPHQSYRGWPDLDHGPLAPPWSPRADKIRKKRTP